MPADYGGIVRSAECRRVREFAEGVRDSAAVLALQGEAGAGKSTLWRAGADAAVAAGHRLLRSEPSASESDMSFAGLSDLLTEVLPMVAADIPAPQLEALEVALLLRGAGSQPPTANAVGLAVLACLRACAAAGPVVVAIDDVQWLDEASVDALAFALRRLGAGPMSLLIAARTEASADLLTAGAAPLSVRWRNLIDALPAAEEIALAPLDMWQIQNLLPAGITAEQARLIARQSRGNPFWAQEILASLDSGDTTVPPLARSLTERLSRSLSPPAAAALAVVAAAGRIGLAEALEVLDDLDDPAAAVDDAVLAGVLVETGSRIAVAHPLISAAAVESMPPGQRSRLYGRLAAIVSADPERYAHFAVLAARPGSNSAVAEALDAAAAAAHARASNGPAAQFAVQAVEFSADFDPATLQRRRIRAAELLFLAGHVEGSLAQLETLDIHQLATQDLERALPLLLDTTELIRGAVTAITLVGQALQAAGTDPRRRALILALASDVVYGIPGERRAAAVEAISCGEAAGKDAAPAVHRALLNLMVAKVSAGEGLDGELIDRAERLEADAPVARLYDRADVCRGLWSRYVEDLTTARTAMRRSIDMARAAGEDYALVTFLSYLAATEELAGDYPTAAAVLADAERVAAWHDWPPSPWHLEPLCELRIAMGQLDEARRIADEQLPDDQSSPVPARFVGAGVRGKVAAWLGDSAVAAGHFELAARCADECEWADPGVRDLIDAMLAEAYLALGRPEKARSIAAMLRSTGTRLGRPALIGGADRIDALAAAQAGNLNEAAELARAAVAAHGESPLRLELARSLLALGRIERRRKARTDSRNALQRAREIASAANHRPLLAEIERELPRVTGTRSRAELTATEQRVAELIGSGATNRDAAAALFVSVRTVETHVASIYRKLGVRTRAELTRHLLGTATK
ncbi:MAG: AAA family ATPase [Streptosporangiaceae bacterium]